MESNDTKSGLTSHYNGSKQASLIRDLGELELVFFEVVQVIEVCVINPLNCTELLDHGNCVLARFVKIFVLRRAVGSWCAHVARAPTAKAWRESRASVTTFSRSQGVLADLLASIVAGRSMTTRTRQL